MRPIKRTFWFMLLLLLFLPMVALLVTYVVVRLICVVVLAIESKLHQAGRYSSGIMEYVRNRINE